NHGLVPDFQTTTVAPPVVDGLSISVAVDVPIGAPCPPPHVKSVMVTWKIGDGIASAFELTPNDTTWVGAFPPEPDDTVILYAVDVQLDDGNDIAFPNNAADPMYQLYVGTPHKIWCETFDTNPLTSATPWLQTGNLGNEWEWGVPGGNAASGDPPAAYTGMQV